MTGLRARTIVEAHLYLDLLRAGGELGDPDPGDPGAWTTLREGADAWTLHADGAGGAFPPFDIEIRYADLAAARRTGIRFGTRASTLIDAAQWLDLAEVYVEQAVEDELTAAATPGDDGPAQEALDAWDFAVDVAAEALRFLPDGAQHLPRAAFWTPRGRAAARDAPERFTRTAIDHRVRTYRTLRDDFAEQLGRGRRWGPA